VFLFKCQTGDPWEASARADGHSLMSGRTAYCDARRECRWIQIPSSYPCSANPSIFISPMDRPAPRLYRSPRALSTLVSSVLGNVFLETVGFTVDAIDGKMHVLRRRSSTVEHGFRKAGVEGSSPSVGFTFLWIPRHPPDSQVTNVHIPPVYVSLTSQTEESNWIPSWADAVQIVVGASYKSSHYDVSRC
jgi:hypothetical protein